MELLPLLSDVLCDLLSGVRIIHHNIQGLLSKSTDMCEWMGSCVNSPNVLCFSETWIRPEGPTLTVPGYQTIYSPHINCNSDSSGSTSLPGSCLFVPDL